MDKIESLEPLSEKSRITVTEVERSFPADKYDALADRYDSIRGVVTVGVEHENAVLLQGPEWCLPGGSVLENEGWCEAARNSIAHLTGEDISLIDIVRLEQLKFSSEGDSDDKFMSCGIVFRASLFDDEENFSTAPTIAEDYPIDKVGEIELDWFSTVPEDPNPNHVDQLELFI